MVDCSGPYCRNRRLTHPRFQNGGGAPDKDWNELSMSDLTWAMQKRLQSNQKEDPTYTKEAYFKKLVQGRNKKVQAMVSDALEDPSLVAELRAKADKILTPSAGIGKYVTWYNLNKDMARDFTRMAALSALTRELEDFERKNLPLVDISRKLADILGILPAELMIETEAYLGENPAKKERDYLRWRTITSLANLINYYTDLKKPATDEYPLYDLIKDYQPKANILRSVTMTAGQGTYLSDSDSSGSSDGSDEW